MVWVNWLSGPPSVECVWATLRGALLGEQMCDCTLYFFTCYLIELKVYNK